MDVEAEIERSEYQKKLLKDNFVQGYVYLSNKNIRMSNNKNMIWQ